MKVQNAFRRGFTLIELMIVIVILGILMGTILPRLTGAQSRARDTARIADLNNISQAMEVYFSDEGEYPPAACAGGTDVNDKCLSEECTTTGDTFQSIRSYMKGDRVPQNVGKKTNTLGCIGSYYYTPLMKGGVDQSSYVLASDLETWQMANYDTGASPTTDTFTSGTAADTYIDSITKIDSEPTTDQQSIYIVIP